MGICLDTTKSYCHMYIHLWVCTYVYIWVLAYECMYACIYASIHVHQCVCILMDTFCKYVQTALIRHFHTRVPSIYTFKWFHNYVHVHTDKHFMFLMYQCMYVYIDHHFGNQWEKAIEATMSGYMLHCIMHSTHCLCHVPFILNFPFLSFSFLFKGMYVDHDNIGEPSRKPLLWIWKLPLVSATW